MYISFQSPARALIRHFWRLWWLKAFGSALFIWLFFQGYFFLLHYPHAQVWIVPLTWVDRTLPMQWWAWFPYLSLWVYTCLPPALMPNLRGLSYYGFAVGLMSALGLTFFYFWPTAIPPVVRPPGTELAFLQGVDTTGNACPSLHVASAVYAALWLHAQLRAVGAGRGWRAANQLWCVLIVYSTLATKQHALLDVLGGLALGLSTGGLALAVYRRWVGGLLQH
jgi:membrane-associated phospholipid phosphatase